MKRMVFAVLLLLISMAPASAEESFDCVPTDLLLQELATIQPPPMIASLDPKLTLSFISGMKELANIPSPVPVAQVTGLTLVSAANTNTMVVLYQVGDKVCGAVRLDKRMGIDILRRGTDA